MYQEGLAILLREGHDVNGGKMTQELDLQPIMYQEGLAILLRGTMTMREGHSTIYSVPRSPGQQNLSASQTVKVGVGDTD